MPTRPVTWDLDIPPEDLFKPVKRLPLPGDPPNIHKLRALLMGTRFELLKISTFAVFLLAFVAIAVHGSHLTNPDNPFAANTNAAFKDLASALSHRTVSLSGKTEAIALAATHKAEVALGRSDKVNPAVIPVEADTTVHGKQAARNRHHAHTRQAAEIQTAALDAKQIHHARRHHEAVEIAAAETSNPQWSGSLRDLTSLLTAEGSKASQKLLDVVQGGSDLKTSHATPHREHTMTSSQRRTAMVEASAGHESTSLFDGLITPDSMIAAMAALLLYLIFVVILVQMRGGLRALVGSQMAA